MYDLSLPNTLTSKPQFCLCNCGVVYWDYRERLNCIQGGCKSLDYYTFKSIADTVGYKIPESITSY